MLMARRWLTVVALAAALGALNAAAATASSRWHPSPLSVGGAVAAPATYSLSQLEALPQTTVTVSGRSWHGSHAVTDTGVAVENLVEASQPTLPNVKNALLRVTVTVAGRDRAVTLA